MTNSTTTPPPWYKQFWPWFLMFFPAVAVVAGTITIIIAVKTDDGLVKDDYYKAGLAINKTLELEQKARELNLTARVNWDKLTQTITLNLSGKMSKLPPRLTMQLVHTTRANYDQTITLFISPDQKSYTGRLETVKSGNWIIILEPEEKSWRINGRTKLPKQTQWQMSSI